MRTLHVGQGINKFGSQILLTHACRRLARHFTAYTYTVNAISEHIIFVLTDVVGRGTEHVLDNRPGCKSARLYLA